MKRALEIDGVSFKIVSPYLMILNYAPQSGSDSKFNYIYFFTIKNDKIKTLNKQLTEQMKILLERNH
jgi:hypothetical protein